MTTVALIWLACSASFLVGWAAHAQIVKRIVTEPISTEQTSTFIDLRDERAGHGAEAPGAENLSAEDARVELRLRR